MYIVQYTRKLPKGEIIALGNTYHSTQNTMKRITILVRRYTDSTTRLLIKIMPNHIICRIYSMPNRYL